MIEFLDGRATLYAGDCLEILPQLAADSIDSCVTDPPYHLASIVKRFGADGAAPAKSNGATGVYRRASQGFMGRTWDGGDVAFRPDTWISVLRVLKPGAHMLAFGAPKNFHRLACAIEDAGFEIRDCIMWMFGSGFPKSHDTAQSIEKLLTIGKARRPDRDLGGLSRHRFSGDIEGGLIANTGGKVELTTPQAQLWEGWGTALKPAYEPIIMARKPLGERTIAKNVLIHGTGGININDCRVGYTGENDDDLAAFGSPNGRWPANVIHDGSEEVIAAFPQSAGALADVKGTEPSTPFGAVYGTINRAGSGMRARKDTGSAARFFYSAKAKSEDRIGSKHPTVKPIELMRYLVRLVTPKGGIVIDPFAGTGTLGEAAYIEGASSVLIEAEPEYLDDIRRRMKLVLAGPEERANAIRVAKGHVSSPGPLFDGLEAANDNQAREEAA